MTLQRIHIDLPSDILLTLNQSEQELKQEIKIALAIQLYLLEKITIGKAAQIADVSRLEFETILSERQIPISNLGMGDVIKDSRKLN